MTNPTFSNLFRAFAFHAFGLPISPEDKALVEAELTRRRTVALVDAILGRHAGQDINCDSALTESNIADDRMKNSKGGLAAIIQTIETEIRKFRPDWSPAHPFDDTDFFDDISEIEEQ